MRSYQLANQVGLTGHSNDTPVAHRLKLDRAIYQSMWTIIWTDNKHGKVTVDEGRG